MYLKSSEVTKIGDKNYLRIFLQKEYPYTIKHNGDDAELLEILFEEPNASDVFELKKLGVVLEKFVSYQTVKSIRIANMFNSESLQQIDGLRKAREEDEEKEQEQSTELKQKDEKQELDKVTSCKFFIAETLAGASDFQDESSNYFLELDKFFSFLEKKSQREQDGTIIKTSLSLLDKYNAISCFIKEEILIEYVGFFFIHFPSKSLHQQNLWTFIQYLSK